MSLIVPKSVIGGDPINVENLLKTKHAIPAYQRDYVWQEKSVRELWDDLLEHYRRHAEKEELPNPEGYFLGAMVVIENEAGAPLEVVDGQQRITTLSTIASILRDHISSLDPDHPSKSGLETRLVSMLGTYGGEEWNANIEFSDKELDTFYLNTCLLKTTLKNKQQYWDDPLVQPKLTRKRSPLTRIKQAIECGYQILDEFLKEQVDPNLRTKRLVSFVRLVTEAVVVLRITAKSYSNAYAIFESLNNRGVPLSQADLIKNELLKIAPEPDREDITDNWTSVRQTIDALDAAIQLPELIHYSYLSRYGRTKAKDLYAATKKLLTVNDNAPTAKKYSEDLLVDARALDSVSENFKAAWSGDTTNMLKDIKQVLGVKLCYPYLIAAYRMHAENSAAFEEHVRTVMNFAFRYMKVIEGSVESLANIISDASIMVCNDKPLADIQAKFKENAPDKEFAEAFEEVSFQNTKLAYFAVFYLEKVQILGVNPLTHGDEQNLEHIMPKAPQMAHWPIAATQKATNPEEFKDYLWRVGNLLPLPASINKSIKNRGIAYKINNATDKHYNAPGLGLESPKGVAVYLEAGDWTYGSIKQRQKYLAHTYAVSAWKL